MAGPLLDPGARTPSHGDRMLWMVEGSCWGRSCEETWRAQWGACSSVMSEGATGGGMRQGVLRLGCGGPSVPVLGRLTGPLRFCCVCGSPRVLSARPPHPRGAVDGPEWVSPGGGPAAPRRCPARGFASSPPGEAGGSGVMPRGQPAPERLARTGALLLRPFR